MSIQLSKAAVLITANDNFLYLDTRYLVSPEKTHFRKCYDIERNKQRKCDLVNSLDIRQNGGRIFYVIS